MPPLELIVFLSALVHEDVAILAAAFFIVERDMSPPSAFVAIFAGIVVNNLLLYGLGASTRRHPWARRCLMNDFAVKLRRRLERHLVITFALSRLGQGMLTSALLGCGWLRVPPGRVAAMVIVTAAVYVPAMLAAAIWLGETVLRRFSEWAWIVPLTLLVVIAALLALRRNGWLTRP